LPTRPLRDQLLVVMGMNTGLRLRELLGLTVGAVWRDGAPVSVLQVDRRNLKGGRGGFRLQFRRNWRAAPTILAVVKAFCMGV
jgi:hypothetical protein